MLNVPHRRQSTAWSCGPACVRSILAYYGKRVPEKRLIEELGANSTDGTRPDSIARFFRTRGYRATARHRMGARSLQRSVRDGNPVIVAYQDYACCSAVDLAGALDHGHYAIITGIDREYVYLCDPSSKRKTRKLERAEFLSRWRDIDSSGRLFIRWGLSIGPKP